jgi:hypothetical protein
VRGKALRGTRSRVRSKEVRVVRRLILVLSVAALMAALLVVYSLPAFAGVREDFDFSPVASGDGTSLATVTVTYEITNY